MFVKEIKKSPKKKDFSLPGIEGRKMKITVDKSINNI